MQTPMAVTRTSNRLPLAALGKLTVAGLVGLALALIYLQAAMIGRLAYRWRSSLLSRWSSLASLQSAGAGHRCSVRSGASS